MKKKLNNQKPTYLAAKKLAKDGKWDDAWKLAQKDESLLSDVTKEKWIKYVSDILNTEAKLVKSSKYHEDKLDKLIAHMHSKGWEQAIVLLKHMTIVADENVDNKFKDLFDTAFNQYTTTGFRDVASAFGDYWKDLSFSNSIDAIDSAFANL